MKSVVMLMRAPHYSAVVEDNPRGLSRHPVAILITVTLVQQKADQAAGPQRVPKPG